MTKTQKTMLQLVGNGFFGTSINNDSLLVLNWNELYTECRHQGVAAMVYDSLVSSGVSSVIDDEVSRRWKQYTTIVFMNHYRLLRELDLLIRMFKNNGVRYAVLKGIAFSLNYPKPPLREHGDIDIYI